RRSPRGIIVVLRSGVAMTNLVHPFSVLHRTPHCPSRPRFARGCSRGTPAVPTLFPRKARAQAKGFPPALSSVVAAPCPGGENSPDDDWGGWNGAAPAFCHQSRLRENLSFFQRFLGTNRRSTITFPGGKWHNLCRRGEPMQVAPGGRRWSETDTAFSNVETRQF